MLKIGQYVEHPKFGLGQVLNILNTGHVDLYFRNAGVKKLTMAVAATLTVVPNAEPILPVPIDIENLERLCLAFHDWDKVFLEEKMDRHKMAHAEKLQGNDGWTGPKILSEIKRRGSLTKVTEARLRGWCHADGRVFSRDRDLAREISTAIYGFVLPEPEEHCPHRVIRPLVSWRGRRLRIESKD